MPTWKITNYFLWRQQEPEMSQVDVCNTQRFSYEKLSFGRFFVFSPTWRQDACFFRSNDSAEQLDYDYCRPNSVNMLFLPTCCRSPQKTVNVRAFESTHAAVMQR